MIIPDNHSKATHT